MMKFSLGEQNMAVQGQIFNIPVSSDQLLNPVTHTKFQDLPYTYNSNFTTCVTHDLHHTEEEISKLHTIVCGNVKVHNEAALCAHSDVHQLLH